MFSRTPPPIRNTTDITKNIETEKSNLKIVGCPFILCVEKSCHNAALQLLLGPRDDGASENVDATAYSNRMRRPFESCGCQHNDRGV
jgi:hypothetical protein